MAMKFSYYYIDANDDYSKIRVFRVNNPIVAFEHMWDFMHEDKKAGVQSRLMLIKTSNELIASLCPRSYDSPMDAFTLKERGGELISSADPFKDLPESASRELMKMVKECQERDMSNNVNGERVPCEVIDEWTLEDLRNK